ncbi:hypothetical protein F4803DRAFT_573165 [Xylaria telfairii]|nr:hypothetical protein F4803DRAFT_573165 [Xylaria telfairii]
MPRSATTSASTPALRDRDAAPKRGVKRTSTDHDLTTESSSRKRTKTSESAAPEAQQRPRLTTPDLEFDYDRSQLRDPRPTPGRTRRPRLKERDLTPAFKERFSIPKPTRPKGRLSAAQKSLLYKEEELLNPLAMSHDLTADVRSAGFQMDYTKVAEWMRPKPYSKARMMKGMERSIDRETRERRETYESFSVEGDLPDSNRELRVRDYVKDHISKDLGVPWHRIGPQHAREWRQEAFERNKFSEWWREPTEEENRRMSRISSGVSWRMDL